MNDDHLSHEPLHPFWPLAVLALTLLLVYLTWNVLDLRRQVQTQRAEVGELRRTLEQHLDDDLALWGDRE